MPLFWSYHIVITKLSLFLKLAYCHYQIVTLFVTKLSLPNCHFYDVTKLSLPNCHFYDVTQLSLPNCHFCELTKLSLPNCRYQIVTLPNCHYRIVITKLSLPKWHYQKSTRQFYCRSLKINSLSEKKVKQSSPCSSFTGLSVFYLES